MIAKGKAIFGAELLKGYAKTGSKTLVQLLPKEEMIHARREASVEDDYGSLLTWLFLGQSSLKSCVCLCNKSFRHEYAHTPKR